MSFPVPVEGPSLRILVALFPGFQLLDVAGPLDMFNILSGPPYNAPLRMSFAAETLDAVPTKLINTPNSTRHFDVHGATGQADVNASFNQRFAVDLTFADALADSQSWDLIFIPGGIGSRVFYEGTGTAANGGEPTLAVQPLLDFIRRVTSAGRVSLGFMTVCTGSDILARTGLLDGRRATTNMLRFEDVSTRSPRVKWCRGARWAKSDVEDGKTSGRAKEEGGGLEVWTSAGVSAGMDLALAFVAEKFGGVEVARDVARRSECEFLGVSPCVAFSLSSLLCASLFSALLLLGYYRAVVVAD
ncbi:uncharacterized protein HMPREF1541_08629 [Cyphellophora europaea CBS 101466]|uniref:DJ-1/PfpI domain-containing protein n=1 Tax=Cyphellophora europaea (strain CBS 101466) TaxID=1220924 RepID=W2RIN2_CYPE1|nr:uncharacterized protein HMPREF1541_08629 [Cyphellophora europaea CBS 101466]ETN36352.1 hypothetical protein HMPREF1541_08629 [Cyphellophora europaea CBS 101466]